MYTVMSSVTVIIPTYNRSQLLVRAINSVMAQTFTNYEILVIDDHSSENISLALKTFPCRVLPSKGRGVSAARNTGVRAANGEWIAFLDSDDEWVSTKLEQQMKYLRSSPNIAIVHTNEIWLRNGDKVRQRTHHAKSGGRIFDLCTRQCIIAPSSVLIRKDVLEDVGMFDENFVVCEDFDLWLRISSREVIGYLEDPLTIKHAGHGDQLSFTYHSMDLWRVRALIKHLGSPNITDREHEALCKSISDKCEILMNGFKKHGNFTHAEEIRGYLEQVVEREISLRRDP